MLLSVRLKKVGETPNTTRYEPLDEVPPLDGYNIDSEFLNSVSFGTFGTEKLRLHLSDEPLPEGTVAIAFPPLPFIRSTKNKTRFEIQNDRGRRLRSSREFPVTQAFILNSALDTEIITAERPLYSGISPIIEAVVKEKEQVTADTSDVADAKLPARMPSLRSTLFSGTPYGCGVEAASRAGRYGAFGLRDGVPAPTTIPSPVSRSPTFRGSSERPSELPRHRIRRASRAFTKDTGQVLRYRPACLDAGTFAS